MKLDNENLFLWRHLDINSDLLLSVVALSTEEIVSFSVKNTFLVHVCVCVCVSVCMYMYLCVCVM